jgi:hypothetical protein
MLTKEIVLSKIARGMSQAAIARQHRVTPQAVSDLLRREPTGRKRGRPRKDAGLVACPHCQGSGRVTPRAEPDGITVAYD